MPRLWEAQGSSTKLFPSRSTSSSGYRQANPLLDELVEGVPSVPAYARHGGAQRRRLSLEDEKALRGLGVEYEIPQPVRRGYNRASSSQGSLENRRGSPHASYGRRGSLNSEASRRHSSGGDAGASPGIRLQAMSAADAATALQDSLREPSLDILPAFAAPRLRRWWDVSFEVRAHPGASQLTAAEDSPRVCRPAGAHPRARPAVKLTLTVLCHWVAGSGRGEQLCGLRVAGNALPVSHGRRVARRRDCRGLVHHAAACLQWNRSLADP